MNDPVLVTGAAGFIGMHVCRALLDKGEAVVGIDNLNDYYSPALKRARIDEVARHPRADGRFRFETIDVSDETAIPELFAQTPFRRVVHLAAQAGVRYSLQAPLAYARSNLLGMTVMLEACRHAGTQHLVYASSSSVYGADAEVPFAETHRVDRPISFYAATKVANEAMAHSYSHLYRLPATGLRFFTVYGPWGRPDMAVWLFTEAIAAGRPIRVFAGGELLRDFTYVDDIVEGVLRVLEHPPGGDGQAPHAVFNIGNHSPNSVNELIAIIERHTGKQAIRDHQPMQPGDVERTFADVSRLAAAVGFRPSTPLDVGVQRFVDWYLGYLRRSGG
ncbi:MAG: GDP-mannose 4,6-dehydratase [Burkholderiales bacterium]|nr:GDP-mannose 4,6-dehydratase [Burkholderiales bacterium]